MSDTSTTLLAALGGGALMWMYADRRRARREAGELDDEFAFVDRDAGDRPPGVPRSLPVADEAPPPSRREVAGRLAPRTYDAVFAAYGHEIPVPYLRALALLESDMNPRSQMKTSSATGLLQVVDVVRRDFNARNGTHYERRDLFDPATNVTIASDLLARIAAGYERRHAEAANLRTDWANPRFVELLTYGWNAGFSERAGVGMVVGKLIARGQTQITIDDVFAAAKPAGAAPTLSNAKKVRWAKAVTAQYLRERARDQLEPAAPTVVAATNGDDAAPVSSPSQVDGSAKGGA